MFLHGDLEIVIAIHRECQFRPAAHAELRVDRVQVVLDRSPAYTKQCGDGAVCFPSGDQLRDLEFPRGE